MSDHSTDRSAVSSPEEFEAALQVLLRDAQANEIDPRGSWISRARNGQADFEIEVVELDD